MTPWGRGLEAASGRRDARIPKRFDMDRHTVTGTKGNMRVAFPAIRRCALRVTFICPTSHHPALVTN